MAKDKPTQAHVVLYQTVEGRVTVDVRFERENFWLTQKALAELFGVNRPAITKHLLNIFSTGELVEGSVCSILEHTAADRKSYSAKYYNLDAAIAVGYRVNSFKATHFRIWATNTLREFIIKGFGLNDEMLKRGRAFGEDYFDELLDINEQEVLTHAGNISHEMAVAREHEEFEKFRVKQGKQYVSNIDEAFARYLKGGSEQ